MIQNSIILFLIAMAPFMQQDGIPGGGGIVYADSAGVYVRAPKGWVFDNKSGVSSDLYAVMYPVGSTWAGAKRIMYVRVGPLVPGQTLEQYINYDVTGYTKDNPDVKTVTAESLQVGNLGYAEVRYFAGDQWGNHEAVAYYQNGSYVITYVLSCRDKDSFNKSVAAFQEVVNHSIPVSVRLNKK